MLFKLWHKKRDSLRKSLKNTYLYKIWGHRLFSDVLWRTDEKSIAGGLALGLFIAFTPTIPFQMLLAVFTGMYLKINLPVALIACWVTNPLTAVPIYAAAWQLGRYIIENNTIINNFLDLFGLTGKPAMIIRQGIYLWAGSLIFAFVSAIVGNVMVRILWNTVRKIRHIPPK
jgi:uncharacterized protein